MTKIKDWTVQINIEGALQKELVEVVEKINKDHNVRIEYIKFDWVKLPEGEGRVTECQMKSNYLTQHYIG